MDLLRSVVISTALYGCESWNLTLNLKTRIAAFEMRCFRRLLQIPYIPHRINISVTQEFTSMIGESDAANYSGLGTYPAHGLSREHYNARIFIR